MGNEKKKGVEFVVSSNLAERRPGDLVVEITSEAKGALPNGTRVEKMNSEKGDNHRNGALGTVKGSVYDLRLGYLYFVRWDDMPTLPIGTVAKKLRQVPSE